MKQMLTILATLISGVAMAGSAEWSFAGFHNAAVSDFQVPLVLEEGVNGFTYTGFADPDAGSDLRVFDTDGTPARFMRWRI